MWVVLIDWLRLNGSFSIVLVNLFDAFLISLIIKCNDFPLIWFLSFVKKNLEEWEMLWENASFVGWLEDLAWKLKEIVKSVLSFSCQDVQKVITWNLKGFFPVCLVLESVLFKVIHLFFKGFESVLSLFLLRFFPSGQPISAKIKPENLLPLSNRRFSSQHIRWFREMTLHLSAISCLFPSLFIVFL